MMTDENKQLMEGELAPQEGTATDLSPALLTLEKHRITCDRKLEPMDFLFQLFGRPCFPRKELVGITGKAKSGKTFLVSMLMTCCVVRDVLSFHRQGDQPLRLLWYDTEQSDESTQDILRNRIMPMTGMACKQADVEKQIDVFNVRGVPWKDRRSLLVEAVEHYAPDLVLVDGIRDLVDDINDGVLAQEVMEELLHLADKSGCCIVCILHQNKGSEDHNLRGWIGTELMHKAFETYACEKLLPDRIFEVKQTLTRKYDITDSLYFRINQDGLPVACQGAQAAGNSVTDNYPQLNKSYIVRDENDQWHVNVELLFGDAIGCSPQMSWQNLKDTVMSIGNIKSWKFYNQLLDEALASGFIVKSFDHVGHVIYALKSF